MSFTLVQERQIPEINALARLYTHDGTGARVLSLINDDENKVFGITFRTPPADSTGVAHIMEHSVLCGSRKYPVKEPFVELIKGSLNTFLNAMTYPDKTCYPVASANLKDFYNLVDVYLDAVFHPSITENTLRQEGWHYELDSAEAPLTYKGVVFNEMKGAYSDPDGRLGDEVQHSLYPDTTYALDSGGDPAVIPELDYAKFKAFHDEYYHPSNSWIYFYGDDDPAERLLLLDTWLGEFGRKKVDSLPGLQPRFEKPKRVVAPYDSGDSPDAKSYVTVNWLLPAHGAAGAKNEAAEEVETLLGLTILAHILTATSASPLRKALIESGLGEDLAGAGLSDELRQMNYSTGLKGVEREDADEVEALVIDTLARLAAQGIDPKTIEASINTFEFAMREKNSGRLPRGIAIMLSALGTWIYDGNPLEALAFDAPLASVKAKIAAGGYFEDLICDYFLENEHRTTVILVPDSGEGARRDALETERLSAVKAAMSEAELEKVMETARTLKELQEKPDTPEALATIPSLKLSDIDPEVKKIPIAESRLEGARLFTHDLATNSILYLDLGFDLHALPQELLPYAGFFGRALLEMGTTTEDFVSVSQRIGCSTGGISPSTITSSVRDGSGAQAWLMFRAKSTVDRAPELFGILGDILLTANLDNRERFRQIVLEEKAGGESALIPSGHRVVNSRLRAGYTEADWAAERIDGLEGLFFLRTLADRIDEDWAGVLADLETVRATLINRNTAIFNVTLDGKNFAAIEAGLRGLAASLPARPPVLHSWKRPAAAHGTEGLVIPAQVNYVGAALPLYELGYEPHGSVHVINKYLGTTWLWEKVRVQGGAYGGFSLFDRNSGIFTFLSYRDPSVAPTLATYDQTSRFLKNLELSSDELEKSIIGTIGDIDAYLLPDAKGYSSMLHTLTGNTPEERQKTRDQVLSATQADFRKFGEVLERGVGAAKVGSVCVMGSAEAIEKAGTEGIGFGAVTKVL